jgi:hypothetical protein
MMLLASTLPENSNDGYVAAAYIVFFAIVLIYVAIMAIRLSRVERDVRTLKGTPHGGGREDAAQQPDEALGRPHPEGTRRERETV